MTILSVQAAKKICEISKWTITNLSVQKIIYFCHMFYLGKNNGEPLIDECFEAWDYGPVLPNLYNELRIFGSNSIEELLFFKIEPIQKKEVDSLIEMIATDLVKRDAWQLVALTHTEDGAWAKNYTPGINKNISNKDILEEYKNKGFGNSD